MSESETAYCDVKKKSFGISEKLAKVLVQFIRRFLRTKNGKELELLGSVARPFGNDVATDGVIMPQSLH